MLSHHHHRRRHHHHHYDVIAQTWQTKNDRLTTSERDRNERSALLGAIIAPIMHSSSGSVVAGHTDAHTEHALELAPFCRRRR